MKYLSMMCKSLVVSAAVVAVLVSGCKPAKVPAGVNQEVSCGVDLNECFEKARSMCPNYRENTFNKVTMTTPKGETVEFNTVVFTCPE